VYVTNSSSRSVSVIDTASNAVSATVTVGSSPWGIAVHPNGSRVYVANNGSGTVSVIDTTTNAVVASPFAAFGLFGIGVTPSGDQVYAASEDDNAVFVMGTSTNTVTDRIPVNSGPAAFGSFFASASASCDTSDLQAALASTSAALATSQTDLASANTRASQCQAQLNDRDTLIRQLRDQIAQLQAANAALITQNQTLTAQNESLTNENARLRNQLIGSSDLIHTLVSVLFGDRPDAEVAAVVRDVTGAELAGARAAAPRDPRLGQAQRAFDAGLASMSARDWKAAIRNFRDAYTKAEQIYGEASARSGQKSR